MTELLGDELVHAEVVAVAAEHGRNGWWRQRQAQHAKGIVVHVGRCEQRMATQAGWWQALVECVLLLLLHELLVLVLQLLVLLVLVLVVGRGAAAAGQQQRMVGQ